MGVTIAIVLIVLSFVALIALVVVRKVRSSQKYPAAAQNASRDPSEGLKLEADGSVLQEVMQSFSRTPNSTVTGNQFDTLASRSSDDHSVEVGVNGYTDNPNGNSTNENLC